jgi:glycogen debranching enzyme
MDEIDALLSDEGWPYASTPPVEEGDPGRFNALFGRDSLICSLQLLPGRPRVVEATLRALAARQGRRDHPDTCEEPGKIGHEFRDRAPQGFLDLGWPDEGAFAYYGTADATSWFLIVMASVEAELSDEMEDSWRAAAGWLDRALERGGGLVRHVPGDWPALTQQGWRDTVDPTAAYGGGILRPDGTVPQPPLADADSQAAAYAALKALTTLDPDGGWDEKARALRGRLSAIFTPEVMAIEAGDRAVPGAGSQLGWLLWADALEDDARDAAAERLCRPDILTDFGLRTLSSDSDVFDPHHYHRGSVWPFDSWFGWGGLRAAGRRAEAERVRRGVLAALDRLGRSPELYAVTRGGSVEPVALSNRVQAWTVGARWAFENDWDGLSPR